MTNNVFIDNQLVASGNFTGSGSALFINRASTQIWHTTIARNHGGDGSGVFVTDSFSARGMAALTNTILASHIIGISVTANNTVTLNSVLWYANTINYGGLGTIITTNEYTGNPALSSDGYHLTIDSAAIDLGLNAGIDRVHIDIDGDPRPMGNGYDLGADEFIGKTYLPVIIKS